MRHAAAPVCLLCLALACAGRGGTTVRLAIQPFGSLPAETVRVATGGIAALYRVEVAVLPAVELPASAYYRPNDRYRAEKLLDFLDGDRYRDYDHVLGLTDRDISTTKGEIPDWGIFGLGSLGGRPCVVSTFRLRRAASPGLFYRRLVKVVNHELGHTFGLPHCPVPRCLMEDAKGTIVTVDHETGELCDRCRKRLGELYRGGKTLP